MVHFFVFWFEIIALIIVCAALLLIALGYLYGFFSRWVEIIRGNRKAAEKEPAKEPEPITHFGQMHFGGAHIAFCLCGWRTQEEPERHIAERMLGEHLRDIIPTGPLVLVRYPFMPLGAWRVECGCNWKTFEVDGMRGAWAAKEHLRLQHKAEIAKAQIVVQR